MINLSDCASGTQQMGLEMSQCFAQRASQLKELAPLSG